MKWRDLCCSPPPPPPPYQECVQCAVLVATQVVGPRATVCRTLPAASLNAFPDPCLLSKTGSYDVASNIGQAAPHAQHDDGRRVAERQLAVAQAVQQVLCAVAAAQGRSLGPIAA